MANKGEGKIDYEINKKVRSNESLTDPEGAHQVEDTLLKRSRHYFEFLKNNDEKQIPFRPKGLPENGHGTAI